MDSARHSRHAIISAMDIHAGILASAFLLVIFSLLILRTGWQTILASRKMTFYRLRQERVTGGWRLIGIALFLFLVALWLPFFGEPIAYHYFPPSPTPTLTSTITVVPSITATSTITLTPVYTNTPELTNTPTVTFTPYLPLPVVALFQSIITPNPDTIFSPLQFTTKGPGYPAASPATVFQNPVGHMYAIFTYDNMAIGSQWTAIWYRDGVQVNLDTKPWNCANCSTGGSGYTDWDPPPSEWLPGTYEVRIFVGEEWKVIGQFIVQGNAPTAIPSPTATPTVTPKPPATPSATSRPSKTPPATGTP